MGKFEIYNDKKGEFRFRLKASNGQNILASEGYASKKGCENGIASVQKNCADDNCFDRLEASNGKPYFNLKSTNGQVVGSSQRYASTSSMEDGIKSVRNNAPGAKIDDLC